MRKLNTNTSQSQLNPIIQALSVAFFILLVFITIIFLLTLFILYNQESFKKVKLNGEFFKTLTKGLTKTWKRGMKSINPYFNHIKTMIEGYLGSKKS